MQAVITQLIFKQDQLFTKSVTKFVQELFASLIPMLSVNCPLKNHYTSVKLCVL